jgi:hypothetical protein
LARDAAERFARDYYDEDIAVLLLQDIRQVFDARSVDRLFSKDLVEALRAKEDAPWCEWRGPLGSQQPRPLSQNQLAAVLRLFNIRPRSIWPPRGTRSFKGYHRHQFEAAWAAYCGGETDRPAERGPINQLRGA